MLAFHQQSRMSFPPKSYTHQSLSTVTGVLLQAECICPKIEKRYFCSRPVMTSQGPGVLAVGGALDSSRIREAD